MPPTLIHYSRLILTSPPPLYFSAAQSENASSCRPRPLPWLFSSGHTLRSQTRECEPLWETCPSPVVSQFHSFPRFLRSALRSSILLDEVVLHTGNAVRSLSQSAAFHLGIPQPLNILSDLYVKVYSLGFDECIISCVHHHSSVRKTFTDLTKNPLCSVSSTSTHPTPNPWQTLIILLSL